MPVAGAILIGQAFSQLSLAETMTEGFEVQNVIKEWAR
jgi:hypothetical protein